MIYTHMYYVNNFLDYGDQLYALDVTYFIVFSVSFSQLTNEYESITLGLDSVH